MGLVLRIKKHTLSYKKTLQYKGESHRKRKQTTQYKVGSYLDDVWF